MREQALFHAGEEHQRKLQPLALCSVISVTGALFVERIGIGHQRRMIQEIADASRRARPLPPRR